MKLGVAGRFAINKGTFIRREFLEHTGDTLIDIPRPGSLRTGLHLSTNRGITMLIHGLGQASDEATYRSGLGLRDAIFRDIALAGTAT